VAVAVLAWQEPEEGPFWAQKVQHLQEAELAVQEHWAIATDLGCHRQLVVPTDHCQGWQ
jgi:hypothetical protein